MANSVSGNSIALKSFQSFMVNEGLLSKTVEAIKAGEKSARSTGVPQSFEVMYRGFRQMIAIGKVGSSATSSRQERSGFSHRASLWLPREDVWWGGNG